MSSTVLGQSLPFYLLFQVSPFLQSATISKVYQVASESHSNTLYLKLAQVKEFSLEFSVGHLTTQVLLIYLELQDPWGFPGGSDSKESACNAGDLGSIPGSGTSPWGGNGNSPQYPPLKNPQGQRSLVGYSPWDSKESDMFERLSIAQSTGLKNRSPAK